MTSGKVITGIILLLGGIALLFVPVVRWIYGPILIVLGAIIIFLSDSDQKIEQRKDLNKSNTKK